MLLGGVAWIGSHDLDPAKPLASDTPPLEVQVVSLDWKWLFIYPDQRVASVNQLVVPAGMPHPFLADLGERDERVLRAAARQHDLHDERHDDAAEPAGGCARHVPRPFEPLSAATVSRTCISTCRRCRPSSSPPGSMPRATPGPTLDADSYADLAKQSMNTAPFTFRAADPELFHADRHAATAARTRPADGPARPERIPTDGALACWASSAGQPFRSTSRSR